MRVTEVFIEREVFGVKSWEIAPSISAALAIVKADKSGTIVCWGEPVPF